MPEASVRIVSRFSATLLCRRRHSDLESDVVHTIAGLEANPEQLSRNPKREACMGITWPSSKCQ